MIYDIRNVRIYYYIIYYYFYTCNSFSHKIPLALTTNILHNNTHTFQHALSAMQLGQGSRCWLFSWDNGRA